MAKSTHANEPGDASDADDVDTGLADTDIASSIGEPVDSAPESADELPLRLHYATPPMAAPHPTLRHSGLTVARFYGMHALGATVPMTAGLLLYGWRALGAACMILGSAAAALWVFRRVAPYGGQLRWAHALWLSLLLSMVLPAQLFSSDAASWALLPAGAIALVALTWWSGGVGAARIHPVLLVYLLLAALFPSRLVPHAVLPPGRMFVGDVNRTATIARSAADQAVDEPWTRARPPAGADALWRQPAAIALASYTVTRRTPERSWVTLESLLRDRLPPLEDLIIAGQPAAIGCASAIAIIVGGLFLLYRGLIDYRIPLLIGLGAFATLLLLPVPVRLTESGAQWRWLAGHASGVRWSVAITFVNYELMAGPLLFMAFFLATSSSIRPMAGRARALYALLIGIAAAALQLYVSVQIGAYVALLLVSLLTPLLDRLFRPRTLV